MHCDCFIKLEDLIFVDDKLSVKTAKIMSLKKLYVMVQHFTITYTSL